MRVTLRADGDNFGAFLRNLGVGYYRAAQEAVADQTVETQRDARFEVATKLQKHSAGRSHVANTIRRRYYPTGTSFAPGAPAGFVHSTWGHRSRRTGEFVDILAVHVRGETIRPVDRDALFIPFAGTPRLRRGRQSYNQMFPNAGYVPRPGGGVYLRERLKGGGRGRLVGMLLDQVTIPPRLDMERVRRKADEGLIDKLVIELSRVERHAANVEGRRGARG